MVSSIKKPGSLVKLALSVFIASCLHLSLDPGVALAQQSPLSGKLIRKITIEGLDKTPQAEILGRLQFRIGERYNPDAVEGEAAKLFALGKFKRVLGPYESKYEDGVAIRFVVVEKPLVYKINYQGIAQLSESNLYSSGPSLRLQEGDLFNEYLISQDEQTIRQKYLKEGFLFVEIDHVVESTTRGVIVSFIVSEGNRVQVEEIRFSRNAEEAAPKAAEEAAPKAAEEAAPKAAEEAAPKALAFSASELLDNMTIRPKGFWILDLFSPGYFNHKELQQDIVKLKKFYRSHGYMDVQIEPQAIDILPEKDGLTIDILIDEGELYVFDGYLFTGNTVFSEQVLSDLTKATPGLQFDQEKLDRDQKAILDYYKDRAYLFARVTPRFVHSLDTPSMRVRFAIEENNEIHINKIKVEGNLRTQDRVIRRELEFYPGEKIDNSRLVKSHSNLSRLGIFQRINYSYEPTTQPSYRDVVVDVDEVPNFGNFMFGFGLSGGHGLFGNFQLTKKNFDIFDTPESLYDLRTSFIGAGQTLSLNLSPGTIWSRYQVTFIEPYLMDTRNSLRLNFRSIKWWRRRWEERHTGFLPSISHAFDFDRDLRARFGARIGNVKIDNVSVGEDGPPAPAEVVEGSTGIIGLNLGMAYDKLLYRPYEGPYDGHKETVDYEFAAGFFGSELEYHKIRVGQSLCFPVYEQEDGNHHVVAFKANLGLIEPFGDTDELPIFERFFLGGPQTVKGFSYRGLGPHDQGVPIGSTSQIWGTLEYGFPIFEQMLRGVVFLDYGNLQELSDFRFEEMRYVVGVGARLNFPLLGGIPIPIGLFLGTPLKHQPDDETKFFLFSIGNIF